MKTWEERLREAMAERGYSNKSEFSLKELVELAQEHDMTPWELHQQRISFAVGMLPESTAITREDLERAAQAFWGDHLSVIREDKKSK